jgi:hypothetical protein
LFSKKLEKNLVKQHSILFHVTKIESAKKILETKLIHGTDAGQHANFSINGVNNVALHSEVSLRFKWSGEHETMVTPGLNFSPIGWEPRPDVLYHCNNDEPPHGRYLQSNLFPGSKGLIFVGAEPLFEVSKKQKLWRRLLSSDRRSEHKNYFYQQRIFDSWKSYEGQSVGVTPWDKTMPRKHPYA